MIEQLVGISAFVILNGSVLLISRAALELFPQRRRGSERVLIATAVFLLSATAMVTLLGMFGLLNRLNLVILAGLLGIVAAAALFRSRAPVAGETATEPSGRFAKAAVSALAGVAALWLAQAFFLGIRYRGDDLSYHGLNLGRWLLDQAFSLQAPAVQTYYPANATAMALWFSIPFSSDAYAGLTGLAYGLLLALGVLCLLQRSQVPTSVAALIAAALLWSDQLRVAGFSLTATDLAGPALIVAGLFFTLPDSNGRRSLTIDAVMAGLLGGSAVGVKPSFMIPAAVLFLITFFRNRRAGGFRFAASRSALFACAGVAAGGYWYLRNFMLTGNPLFPMENLFFSGPYPRQALRDSTMAYLFAKHGSLALAGTALRIVSDWPRTLGALALVGYLQALLSLARRKRKPPTAASQASARLLAVGAAWLIAYPLLPFSGGNSTTFAAATVHPHIARFLILPFACGLTLAGLINWTGRRRFAAALAAMALPAEEIFFRRPAWDALAMVGLAFLLFFALLELLPRLRRRKGIEAASGRRFLWPACVLALLLLLGALEPFKLRENRRRMAEAYRLEGLLSAVESWDRPTISGIMRINYAYPLFGSRFQNDVLWLDPGGIRRPPIHEVFLTRQAGGRFALNPFREDAFVENLRSAGVDYLMLVNFGGPEAWPEQHQCLIARDDAERVWESPRCALWRLQSP